MAVSNNHPFKKLSLVSASILAADFANLEKEINLVTKAGADFLHLDVMDGHFVKNITIGPPVVQSIKKITSLPLDVHLMIEKPEKYIEAFAKAGASFLTIHVEATQDPVSLLKEIRHLGVRPGISLRPRTDIKKILPYLELVDLALVMTVEPGFAGQSFMYDQVFKIQELNQYRQQTGLSYLIEVDGGVNEKTFIECQEADVLVAGNFIFKNDYTSAIQLLKARIQ